MIDAGRLFPHRVFGELALRPEDVIVVLDSGKQLSVKARPAVATQPNEFALYADEEVGRWSALRIGVRVFAQEDLVKVLLPKGSLLSDNAVMLVAASCRQTKLRRRIFLTKDPDRPAEWYGEIDLSSADVAGTLELSPQLARTTRFPETATDDDGVALAAYRGAIIGFGDPIRVFVDEPKHDRGGGLRVTWEDFSKSPNDWRKAHAGDMFYVDTSEESPQVLLNSKHDLLKQTLMKKRPRGTEAAIKATMIAYVAHTTWSTMFLAAMADCVEEDGDAAWPSDAVKAKVLRRLLPSIMPERTDPDDRLEAALELYQDPTRCGTLMTKLHSAIQSVIKVDDFVVQTLEAAIGDDES